MRATQSSTALGGSGLSRLAGGSEGFPLQETLDGRGMTEVVLATPAGVAEGLGLAHDVGNLLGALGLYADLLAQPGVLHEPHKQYADEIRLLSERSRGLMERLVLHAREQSRAASREVTVLPDVIDACRGLLSRVAQREIVMEFGPGSHWPVAVPAEMVERILTNLVKNAGEAIARSGQDAGEICIHVEAVGGAVPRLVMVVADSGGGMSEERLRSLEDAGRMVRSGRGLGLRVVRELVALSGGCMEIESRPRFGTAVTIEWDGVTRPAGRPMRLVEAEAGWIAC
jgi:signal transduction histidine kinase